MKFVDCTFLEAMTGLHNDQRIRFIGLPEGYFFQINVFGEVLLRKTTDNEFTFIDLRRGLAIMTLSVVWQIEEKVP